MNGTRAEMIYDTWISNVLPQSDQENSTKIYSMMSKTHLWRNAKHLQRWRNIQIFGNFNMSKVNAEFTAPDTQPVNVKDSKFTGKGDHQALTIISTKGFCTTIKKIQKHCGALFSRGMGCTLTLGNYLPFSSGTRMPSVEGFAPEPTQKWASIIR